MERLPFKKNAELVEEITEELANDAVLKSFFIKHDIDHETIENHLNDLMTFQQEHPRCRDCEGLHACSQDTRGHQPELLYRSGTISLAYHPCNFLIHHRKIESEKRRVDALYMPEMIFKASLSDFRMNTKGRKELYQKMMKIVSHVKLNQTTKGLYLHGAYRVGKTYALAALSNQLATYGKHVVLAYYPDLARELKSSIRSGELETMVARLKTVDVLMLDDIGGEAPSQWVRDEVLGPVLQHRLLDEKLTCFSSNVAPVELVKYMSESSQKAEQVKAYRIIERIVSLSEEVKMEDA